METILNIFTSLGADSTFFVQLIVIIALYFILKTVLFEKLQEVLELRESKTTKLEGNANKKLAEAEHLAKKYNSEIANADQEAFSLISSKKIEALSVKKEKIKLHDKKLNSEIVEKRKVFTAEIEVKTKELLKSSSKLSESLVQKLTN